jgi:tape measure domain-containing protein
MADNIGTLEFILKINSELTKKDLKKAEEEIKKQTDKFEKMFSSVGKDMGVEGIDSLKKKLSELKKHYEDNYVIKNKTNTAGAEKELRQIQNLEVAILSVNKAYKLQANAIKEIGDNKKREESIRLERSKLLSTYRFAKYGTVEDIDAKIALAKFDRSKATDLTEIDKQTKLINRLIEVKNRLIEKERALTKAKNDQESAERSLNKQRSVGIYRQFQEQESAKKSLEAQRSRAFVSAELARERELLRIEKERTKELHRQKLITDKQRDVRYRQIEVIDSLPEGSIAKLKEYIKYLEITKKQSSDPKLRADVINSINKEKQKLAELIKLKEDERKANERLFAQQKLQTKINSEARGSVERMRAVYAKLRFEFNNVDKSADGASKRLEILANRMSRVNSMIQQLNPTLGVWGRLKNAITTYATAYLSVQGAIQSSRVFFRETKELDQLAFAMKTVIKNSSELAQTQKFLSEVASNYGGDLLTLSERYIKFRAAAQQSNMSAAETMSIFDSVSKAAGTLGLKTDELSGVYLALEQMISKGKVTTEELRRQLGERLPGAFGIMANALGVTLPELDKMLKKGEVLSKDALPKFAIALEKAYGIESLKKIDTLAAAQGRLSTETTALIKDFNASSSFKAFFNGLAGFIRIIRDILPQIKFLGITLISLAAGWALNQVRLGALMAIQYTSLALFGVTRVKVDLLSKSMITSAMAINKNAMSWRALTVAISKNIWGLALQALVLITTWVIAYSGKTKEAADATKELSDQYGKLNRDILTFQRSLDRATKGTGEYANALQGLNSIALKYNQELLTEKNTRDEVNTSIKKTIDLVNAEYLAKRKAKILEEAQTKLEASTSPLREAIFGMFPDDGNKALLEFQRIIDDINKGISKEGFRSGDAIMIQNSAIVDRFKSEIGETITALKDYKKITDSYKADTKVELEIFNPEDIEKAKEQFDTLAELTKVGEQNLKKDLIFDATDTPTYIDWLQDKINKFKTGKFAEDSDTLIKLILALKEAQAPKGKGGGEISDPFKKQTDALEAQVSVVTRLKQEYDKLDEFFKGNKTAELLKNSPLGKEASSLGIPINFDLTDDNFAQWAKQVVEKASSFGTEAGDRIATGLKESMTKQELGDLIDPILTKFDRDLDEFEQKQQQRESIFGITGDRELSIKLAFDTTDIVDAELFVKDRLVRLVQEAGYVDIVNYDQLLLNLDKFSPKLQKSIEQIQKYLFDKQSSMLVDALQFIYQNTPEGVDLQFDFSKIVNNLDNALREIKTKVALLIEPEVAKKLNLSEEDITRLKNLQINAANEVAKNAADKLSKNFIKDSLPEQLKNDFEDMQDASIQSIEKIIKHIEDMKAKLIGGETVTTLFDATKLDNTEFQAELDLLINTDSMEAFTANIDVVKGKIADMRKESEEGMNFVKIEDINKFEIFVKLLEALGIGLRDAGDEANRSLIKKFVDNFKELKPEIDAVIDSIGDLADALGIDISESGKLAIEAIKDTATGVVTIISGVTKLAEKEISNVEKASAILTIISTAIKVASAIAKVVKDIADADRVADIEREERSIDALARSYNRLENAMKRTYGDQRISDRQQIIKNLNLQIEATRRLINLEQNAKKPDNEKIRGYIENIYELQDSIDEITRSIAEDLLGGDLVDLAKEFGDTLIEAFRNGEDATKAWGDKVKETIYDAIITAATSNIIAKALQPMWDYLDDVTKEWDSKRSTIAQKQAEIDAITATINEGPADGDVDWEINKRAWEDLRDKKKSEIDILNSIPFMTDQQINESIERGLAGADTAMWLEKFNEDLRRKIGLPINGTSSTGGIRGEIQAIQEPTARQIEGLLNTIRETVVNNNSLLNRTAQSSETIQAYAAQNLAHLVNIDANTKGQLDLLTSLVKAGASGTGLKVYVS